MLLHQTLLPFLCFSASSFIERISEIEAKREAILILFGCSEVNSTWIITSGLANQGAPKALFTCVVYTKMYLFTDTEVNNCFSIYHTSWINSGPRVIFFLTIYRKNFARRAMHPHSGKRIFIVKCSVSPTCWQIKLLQALVKLLRCHFLNGWVKFLLLLKPSWKTSDVSLFSLWF